MFKRIINGFVSVLLLTGFCWPQMASAQEENGWDWRNGVPEYEDAKIKITAEKLLIPQQFLFEISILAFNPFLLHLFFHSSPLPSHTSF